MRSNENITISELAQQFKVNKKTIKRDIIKLKKERKIKRIGSDKGGHWEIVK